MAVKIPKGIAKPPGWDNWLEPQRRQWVAQQVAHQEADPKYQEQQKYGDTTAWDALSLADKQKADPERVKAEQRANTLASAQDKPLPFPLYGQEARTQQAGAQAKVANNAAIAQSATAPEHDDWKSYLQQQTTGANVFNGSMSAEDIALGYGDSAVQGDENLRVPVNRAKITGYVSGPDAWVDGKPQPGMTLKDLRLLWLRKSADGDSDAVKQFQLQLIHAGLLDPTANNFTPGQVLAVNDPTMVAANRAWTMAIEQGKDVHDVMDALTKKNGNGGPITTTSTKSTVSKTDPTTAQGIITSTFQKLMGRDPSQAEIAELTGSLNAAEAAAPVSSTETDTTTVDPNSLKPNTNASVSSSGGVDPSQVVQNAVNGQYGGEVHTHGQNAFMGSLLSLLGIGGA